MTSAVDKVQDIIKEFNTSSSQFYNDYKKTSAMYQDLLDKGVVSKRQSQLLTISDRKSMPPVHFNNSK